VQQVQPGKAARGRHRDERHTLDLCSVLDASSNKETKQMTEPLLTGEEIDDLVQVGIDNGVKDMRTFARMIQHATLRELADRIQKMPFGDTASSFAVYVREHASPNWDWPGREQL
jgi:hypothetical protein